MNMKNWKNFFRVHGHSAGGFTLVELIVVIAILAILAGVAIPAYSGYIKKAEQAGDQQLLDAINSAFASACLTNHTDPNLIDTAKVKVIAPLVDGANGGKKLDVANVTPYGADFAVFFAGNENAEFKGVTKIVFDPILHMFVDAKNASKVQITLGGQVFEVLQSSIDAVKGTVFHKNITAMQNQLSGISNAFSGFIGNVDAAGTISPEFKAYMEAQGYKDEDLGNAAVLYVAQNAGDYTAQDVAEMFQNCANYIEQNSDPATGKTPAMGDILNGAFAEGEDGLTNAALMYGAVTAFANSDKCNDPELKNTVANVSDGQSLIDLFMGLNNNPAWSDYLGNTVEGDITASEQFTTDMNGFFGAMDAIDTVSPGVNTDDPDYWKNDEDVNKLLEELLGKEN